MTGAFPKKGSSQNKLGLKKARQNKFCTPKEPDWSAKFILRLLEYKIYFAVLEINNDPFFGNAPHAKVARNFCVNPRCAMLNVKRFHLGCHKIKTA